MLENNVPNTNKIDNIQSESSVNSEQDELDKFINSTYQLIN
jgi:hypothetical protein